MKLIKESKRPQTTKMKVFNSKMQYVPSDCNEFKKVLVEIVGRNMRNQYSYNSYNESGCKRPFYL